MKTFQPRYDDNDNAPTITRTRRPCRHAERLARYASVSWTALKVALNAVGHVGRSGFRRCCSKPDRDGGTLMFGPKRPCPRRAAAGPSTRRRSCAATSASATATKSSATGFADRSAAARPRNAAGQGFPVGGAVGVNMKCLDGTDRRPSRPLQDNDAGGIEAVRTDRRDPRPAQWRAARRQGRRRSRSWKRRLQERIRPAPDPVLTVVDWMSLDGPARRRRRPAGITAAHRATASAAAARRLMPMRS